MKKLLALVLALVMTLSLCVTSNAAYAGEEFDYDEAVEVMSAIGVFQGDQNGKFNPKDILTREQAAKIVTYMLLGKKSADALVTIAAPFADVAADRWSAGSIAYCYNEGILAGVGEGKFAPTAQLTGLAFAKMMLTALGYDAEVEGLTGANWSINAAKLALTVGLTKGLDNVVLSQPMTREQAAKMALNTEKATLVEYNGQSTIIAGGITVKTQAKASKVINTAVVETISPDDYMQFAEQYCTKLVKDANTDHSKRPATVWTYDKDEVGTYSDAADETLVVAKYGKSYDYMLTTINSKYTVTTTNCVYINGATVSASSATAKVGDVMEIYMSETVANKVDKIVVTQYVGDEVTAKIVTKTSDGTDYVRVPGVIDTFTKTSLVHGYEDLAKDDIVYTYTTADGHHYLAKANLVEGKMTSYTKFNGNTPAKYVINGTTYMANGKAAAAAAIAGVSTNETTPAPVFNTAYNYYTDANGYIVYGVEAEDTLSDYVVLQTLAYKAASGVTGASVEGRLVFMDGTTKVVSIDKVNNGTHTYEGAYDAGTNATYYLHGTTADNLNDTVAALVDTMFFTYKIDTDGNYELTKAAGTNVTHGVAVTDASGTISSGSVQLSNGTPVDDDTVFVVAKATNGKTFATYTGKSGVPSMTDAEYVAIMHKGIASYVYVSAFATKTNSGDSVFFLQNYNSTGISYTTVKKDDNSTYQYADIDAIVDGKLTTVKVTSTGGSVDCTNNTNIAVGKLLDPTYNSDGVITAVSASAAEAQTVVYGYSLVNTTLTTKSTPRNYVCSDTTPVFYKDADGNYTKSTFAEYAEDANDAIYVVVKDNNAAAGKKVVDYAYVIEMADLGLTGLSDNRSSTLDMTKAVNTVVATQNQSYTVTATVAATEKFNYSTDGTTWGADNTAANNSVTCTDAGKTYTVYVKVTNTASGNYTIYTVNYKAPANNELKTFKYTPAGGTATPVTLTTGTYIYNIDSLDKTKDLTLSEITLNTNANATIEVSSDNGTTWTVNANNTVVTAAAGATKTVQVRVTNDSDATSIVYTFNFSFAA